MKTLLASEKLSLTDPRFNIREIVKQMLLLEDHLAHPNKKCNDCILKHFMTIEAYAEEAASLDVEKGVWGKMGLAIAEAVRDQLTVLAETPDSEIDFPAIGQAIRATRKTLAPQVFSPVGKVAFLYENRLS